MDIASYVWRKSNNLNELFNQRLEILNACRHKNISALFQIEYGFRIFRLIFILSDGNSNNKMSFGSTLSSLNYPEDPLAETWVGIFWLF